MRHSKNALVLLLLVGCPGGVDTTALTPSASCLSFGEVSYRLVSHAAPSDYIVRVVRPDEPADVRLQAVERPEIADLVLIDDGGVTPCRFAQGPVRTVKLTAAPVAADLTIRISQPEESANYRIFVRARDFSPLEAAAVFAISRKPLAKQALAAPR